MFRSSPKKLAALLGAVAALGLCAWLADSFFLERHRLSFVPTGLDVSRVLYAKEDAWGFGPGGNETGVVVYALSEDATAKVQAQGITYLSGLPPNPNAAGDWRGRYESWLATPQQLEGSDSQTHKVLSFEVAHYLNRYGFGIDIDPTVQRQINDAISNGGSFLAHGRTGVLIVAPSIRRVFYIYNG